MTKTFLIATVAAFAITAPAQATDQSDRRSSSEQQQAKKKRGEQRVVRAKAQTRAKAQARAAERRQNVRAQTRASVRSQAPRVRAQARAKVRDSVEIDRPARVQARSRLKVERPQARKQVRIQRTTPKVEARARQQDRAVERRAKLVELRARQQDRAVERRAKRVELRARQQNVELRARQQNRVAERRAKLVERARKQRVETPRAAVRARISPPGLQRRAEVHARNAIRFQQKRELQQERKLQLRARQLAGARALVERRDDNRRDALARRLVLQSLLKHPSRKVGERVNLRQRQVNRDWYDDYRARRYSRVAPTSRYVYDYNDDDGYLYKIDRERNAIAALYPLLGGAFRVAQPMPVGYNSYNVPSAYRSLYYDTPNYQYRYGDGAIYRVDPKTQLIQTVVALLTGQNLGVGQMLPAGYDVYNVPYAYRQRFADRENLWYRYSDGHVYGVDPYSRRIQSMYPINYGGYSVGYPAPSYASYGGYTGYGSYGGYARQPVPYGYNRLYYGQPGYNYQYAGGGIYQVDPMTQIVRALVALVTGTNLSIGQVLPTGFDAYNVPSAYRSTYFDTPDSWYRYNNGSIYQVDPYSRVVQAAIPVSYGGYMVGQPVPAAYPGYAVPNQYSGLYNAAPGYDYRYFDGGIYAVNPQTQIVQSQVALLTGQTFGVGQMLPMGYDAYNVPFAYRDRYSDSDRSLYRYADGRIYQVDPTTRLIQAVINAIV